MNTPSDSALAQAYRKAMSRPTKDVAAEDAYSFIAEVEKNAREIDASRGGADEPERCERCGDVAIHYLVMDNVPGCRRMPYCGNCSHENEQQAQEVNDHEMRNFGGAYGLVAFHYEPLDRPATARAGVERIEDALSYLQGSHIQNNKARMGAIPSDNIDRVVRILHAFIDQQGGGRG